MAEDCFYKDGLDFACRRGCVRCCAGEPGFVFLNDEDIARLAEGAGVAVNEAIELYTREVVLDDGVKYRVLREYSDNRCVFLGDAGCKIYTHRPMQCRAYPFWNRVLKSKETWDEERSFCPGINDPSEHVDYNEIEKRRKSFKFPYLGED